MSNQLPVKLDPVADSENCWKSVRDLFALLGRKMFVELPAYLYAKIWSGPAEPPADKKDWLWYNETVKGKPVGFYTFYKGEWKPVWPTARPSPILCFAGRVDTVEEPFTICDGRDGTPDLTILMTVEGTGAAPVAADFISGTLGDGPLKDEVVLLLGYMQLTGYSD